MIDALQYGLEKLQGKFQNQAISELSSKIDLKKKLILVTGHRRENFGEGLRNICLALLELASKGYQIIYPVHLNPEVKEASL